MLKKKHHYTERQEIMKLRGKPQDDADFYSPSLLHITDGSLFSFF